MDAELLKRLEKAYWEAEESDYVKDGEFEAMSCYDITQKILAEIRKG